MLKKRTLNRNIDVNIDVDRYAIRGVMFYFKKRRSK